MKNGLRYQTAKSFFICNVEIYELYLECLQKFKSVLIIS